MAKRVTIIGVGSIGERHVRCFQQTNRAELSLCEINDELRDAVAERYNVQHAYASLDEVIANPPDIAVICTPAHLHIPMALQLAEAGVHMLIEKPLSTTLDDIDQLRTIISKNNLIAGVAYVTRLNPALIEMRQAAQSGRFGRPVQLVYVSGQHFPFYRPAYREIYYTDRATGGGAIQDALTHSINTGEWLVGPITQLAADAEHQVLEGVDVEDTVHVIARHDSVQAFYSMNQHQAPNESTATLVCERGTVRFEAHRNRWRWTTSPEQDWQDEPHPPYERDTLFVHQANMLLDAVENKTTPACSLDEAEQTLRVNLAILKAAETRTWQTV